MNITIFNTASGKILRTASIPTGMASMQLSGDSEDWIEGHYADDQFYVANFAAVAMPPRPSEHHRFNYTTKQWEDPRTLDDLKAAKNAAINAARLKAESQGFMFDGKLIQTDELGKSNIAGTHGEIMAIYQLTGTWALPPWLPAVGWKAQDNSFVPIPTVTVWMQFYQAMTAQGAAHFAHAQALKAQLAAATTPAEVEAVPDW